LCTHALTLLPQLPRFSALSKRQLLSGGVQVVNRRIFVRGLATTASGYGLYAWAVPTEAQSKASTEDDPVLALVADEHVRVVKKMRKARRVEKVDFYDISAAMRMAASRVKTIRLDDAVKKEMARIDPNTWYAPPEPMGPRVRAMLKTKGIEDDGSPYPEPSDVLLNVDVARKLGKVGVSPALTFMARVMGDVAEQVGKPQKQKPVGLQAVAYLPVDWSDDYWCNISSACDAGGGGGGGGSVACNQATVAAALAASIAYGARQLARTLPPPENAGLLLAAEVAELAAVIAGLAAAYACAS